MSWDKVSKVRGLLSVVGFGFLDAAAWTVALPLGLVAIGVSLLLVDFMSEDRK